MDVDLTLNLHCRLVRLIRAALECDTADAEDGASYAIQVAIERNKRHFNYLAACGVNYCRNQWTRRRIYMPLPVTETDDGDEMPTDLSMVVAPGQELTIAATEAIEALYKLPDKMREPLMLIAVGYEPAGVAAEYGLPRSELEWRYRLGRAALKAADFYQPCKLSGHRRFFGVSRKYRKWKAAIEINSKTIYLGSFKTAEEGARAYDAAARRFLGDKARLNFPDEARERSAMCPPMKSRMRSSTSTAPRSRRRATRSAPTSSRRRS